MSTKEYRTSVLNALGDSVQEDNSSTLKWRERVLSALNVTFTNDDLTNTLKWREKVIEGLSGAYSGDIDVIPLSVSQNDVYTAPQGKAYSPVTVQVPNDDSFLIGVIERTVTTGTLPSGLTRIGNNAFVSCTNLAITRIPSGVSSVGNSAFQNCRGLTSITFEGTPTFIDATAFRNCTNILDIYVPWAEDEVANAPWGAENATIHYNSTV